MLPSIMPAAANAEGETVSGAVITQTPAANETVTFTEYNDKAGGDYRLYVEVVTKEASWALKAGHEIAHEQFILTDDILTAVKGAAPAAAEAAEVGGDGVSVLETDDKFTVTGNGFSFDISKKTGFLSNYVYNGKTLIHELKPNYYRDRSTYAVKGIYNSNATDIILPITNTVSIKNFSLGFFVTEPKRIIEPSLRFFVLSCLQQV